MGSSIRVLLCASILVGAGLAAEAQIQTPPDGYWGDYRSFTRGWLDEFNRFRSEQGLPTFVWCERMYVVLVEYANDCKANNLGTYDIPGPCEKPTPRARRVHRWNIGFFDNHTVFLKAAYTPQEAVKSVASVSIIRSIKDPRNNAAAVAIVEKSPEEVYIIMATACIDLKPMLEAKEKLFIDAQILESPEAGSTDRVKALKELAALKNFELAFTFLQYVDDPDPAVARAAVEALGALLDPCFVWPLILRMRRAHADVQDAIAATLARITGRKDLGKDPDRWESWYASQGNALTRPFEVPEEVSDLSDTQVKDLVEEFQLELKNPDPNLRSDAIRKIGRIRHAEVAKAIAKALADVDPAVRQLAAEALAFQAHKATLTALCNAYGMNKDHPAVQTAVVAALGAIGDYRALPTLTKDLMRTDQPTVTEARLAAFGNIRHQESIQSLIDFMWRTGAGRGGGGGYRKVLQESLTKLTGKDFGNDRNAWKKWWDDNKKTFRFPRD